jgi:hypothetical protein
VNIVVGTCNADPRVLDKRTAFTNQLTIPVQIDRNCSMQNPVFLLDIDGKNLHANYCYVPTWNSYYYLEQPTIMDGTRMTVSGKIDYLTTYADNIKTLTGYLIRTGDNAHKNKYLHDASRPVQSNVHVQTYQFDASPFTANYTADICYLLTVIGGKHT